MVSRIGVDHAYHAAGPLAKVRGLRRTAPAGQAHAPQYRTMLGQAVYSIQAGGLATLAAEQDLAGPLRELSLAVLAEGDFRPP